MTKNKKKGPAFLLKTYDMLEQQEFKQIIDWNNEGTGFVVKNPTELAEKVLPKYFKHSNLHSFIRQLNMYGFNKKRGSKVQNFYFHSMFKKGQRDTIFEMQRKVQKKGIHKQGKPSSVNQQLSIEVEQESQFNKQNKIQSNGRNSDSQKVNIMKKIIQLKNVNRNLIIEQAYHLANLQNSNLVQYILKNNEIQNNLQGKEEINQKSSINLLMKFNKIKNLYLKVHSIIWEKLNLSIQAIQSQYMQKNSKNLKETQLQILRDHIKNEQQIIINNTPQKNQNEEQIIRQKQIIQQKIIESFQNISNNFP